ncbi:MAG: DUF3071 domain-containing protein [Nocardioidaceae bacterium]|nr:DUF3071 domain-containing protein [Nocardioidaceae bacterium]
MQHLTPVGLSKDGKTLVLVSDAGEEFAVEVDQRLRTALRGDNARLGQLEMRMESTLRPRDIQARIRAGESAEDVAAAAQTTVEAIMPFAGPVLAERAHVAELALKASIRRRSNDTTPVARTLDEASRQQLVQLGVRADDLAWDAWRRDDGRWTLVAEFAVRGTAHRAEFAYDQPGRYVVAENTDAQVLTGEATLRSEQPAAAPSRRLSAVRDDVDELPLGDELGDDALELVHPSEPAAAEREPEPADEPEPELEPVARTEEPEPADEVDEPEPTTEFDDLAADHADADWIAELPLDAPAPDVREDEPEEAPEAEVEAEPEPEPEPGAQQEPAPEQPRAKKKGRSSVPSWDEIMFGGGGGRD